jgi:hypothetical protein
MTLTPEQMTLLELDLLMQRLEELPVTGDFRFDQAIGLARDRLLMMWAEARRTEDAARLKDASRYAANVLKGNAPESDEQVILDALRPRRSAP